MTALLLLDLAGTRKQRFEIAVFGNQLRRRFDSYPRHARHIIGRIPDQRLYLDHLLGCDAEAFDHLLAADPAILHGIVHHHGIADELHQVLVG